MENHGVEGVVGVSSNDKKMANSSSKRQKAVESDGEGGIDRISGLPESVLLHILSFLPTKTCVCTVSLVSRKWRHLWEHLQGFHFYCDHYRDIELVKRFAFFVNAVLTLRRSRNILKMHLDCGLMEDKEFSMINFVHLWLRAAIGPHLEELHLIFPTINKIYNVVLPKKLLNCSNLVSLSLRGSIDLKVRHSWTRIYFPSLKNLYLNMVKVDSIDALLTGCPILETLDITIIAPPHLPTSRFRVPPSLKRLQYNGFFTSPYIDIDAPCLEYLRITTMGTLDTSIGNMQNVVEAYIDYFSPNDIDSESFNPLLNLLRAIPRTKHLTLCSSTTKLPLRALIQDFPVFRCLLHLDLRLPCFNSKLLAKVLENCHVLQDLEIVSYKEALPPLQIWEPQSARIPNCLVSHVTSVHIKGYRGLEDDHTFVEYILRNALVLKTMIIKSHREIGLEEKLNILKNIINIPRGSDLCEVEFY